MCNGSDPTVESVSAHVSPLTESGRSSGTMVTGNNRPILLKKSGHPADASESRKCWRGEEPQIILRRIKSKPTHSPRRWRLEKPLEIRRPDFFNRIDPQRPFGTRYSQCPVSRMFQTIDRRRYGPFRPPHPVYSTTRNGIGPRNVTIT